MRTGSLQCQPESSECIIDTQVFLPSYDRLPPPPNKLDLQYKTEKELQHTDGRRGEGEKEPNQTTARKPVAL